MSDSLIIAAQPPGMLTFAEIVDVLTSIPEISNQRRWLSQRDEMFDAEYVVGTESRTVYAGSGRTSFSIRATDRMAIAIAIEFAKRFASFSSVPLHLFNASYSFHQILSPELDVDELERRIGEDPFAGASNVP